MGVLKFLFPFYPINNARVVFSSDFMIDPINLHPTPGTEARWTSGEALPCKCPWTTVLGPGPGLLGRAPGPLAPSFPQSQLASLAPSLPLPLLLGRTILDPCYNSHFSATSLGSSLLSSGHHCSLLSLPSLLSRPLPWPGHGSTWPGVGLPFPP